MEGSFWKGWGRRRPVETGNLDDRPPVPGLEENNYIVVKNDTFTEVLADSSSEEPVPSGLTVTINA